MLTVEDINSYYGKAHILHDLSLSVAKGDVLALLGRNGAGKTTTLKSIMQLLPPETGKVQLKEQDITGTPTHRVSKLGLGYVPEERRIFTDLTIEENLEVGRQPERSGVPYWTREILFDLFPNLAERRSNLGKALSGGEQQMLTIARTLMGNPEVLLLDEPSEGIAPVIVEQMVLTIQRIKDEGVTILLSEQNLHFAKLVANRAIIIEGGLKRFDGTMEELNADPDIREAYLSV
ncbi:MAG: ABC transporter ATP-binding protein [Proteobacteria bacterium]|nr:ABC transporter ATP-binding protein [Pseudomonadota bacterium]